VCSLLLDTYTLVVVTEHFFQSVYVSPNGKMFAVLGDHEDGLVVDSNCGKVSTLVYFVC
jgi:hypothetical protein